MPYRDKDKQRQFQREHLAKRRAEWIASQGGRCVRCGSREELEIDHIDPRDKLYNPSHLWSRSLAFREAELAKCQVLCRACHLRKTVSGANRSHGASYQYTKQGCRCEACRAWNARRARNQRRRRRERAEARA